MKGTVIAGTNNLFTVECEDEVIRNCTIKGKVIKTEKEQKDYYKVLCCLTRGFRHQIRAHLAWKNYPIISDSLYNGVGMEENVPLQLHASAVSFFHPVTGEKVFVSLREFFTSDTK